MFFINQLLIYVFTLLFIFHLNCFSNRDYNFTANDDVILERSLGISNFNFINRFYFNYLILFNEPYLQFLFIPEFIFPKLDFAFSFHLPINIDRYWNIRKLDYNSLEAIFSRLNYVKYRYSDNFYFEINPVDNYTLGYGFLLANYSNSLAEPFIRNLAIRGFLDYNFFIFDFLLANVFHYGPFAYRLAFTPFKYFQYYSNFFNSFSFAFSFVFDFDFDNLVLKEIDSIDYRIYSLTFDRDFVFAYSFDINFLLFTFEFFDLYFLGQYARISDFDYAFSYGFRGSVFFYLFDLDYRFEIRYLNSPFALPYFNSFYDLFRNFPVDTDLIDDYSNQPQYAIYFEIASDFFHKSIQVLFSYDFFLQNHFRPHIRFQATINDGIFGLDFKFYYDHFYFYKIDTLQYNYYSWLSFEILYSFNDFIEFGFAYKKSFFFQNFLKVTPFYKFKLFSVFKI